MRLIARNGIAAAAAMCIVTVAAARQDITSLYDGAGPGTEGSLGQGKGEQATR